MADRLLIVGLGHAGQRHARNALALGCEVYIYDLITITTPHQVRSIEEGLSKQPLGVIVATPPDSHGIIASLMLDHRLPCLIEKPITDKVPHARNIIEHARRYSVPLAVGYQLRFTRALRALKARADAGDFGELLAADAYFASQRWSSGTYRADFLLECSHELDLVRWFKGNPTEVLARTSENLCYAILDFDDDEHPTIIHLNGWSDGYQRRLTILGSLGAGSWTFDQTENDAAYLAELQDFLAICRGEQPQPACTGEDGWWALRMVEAIRRSAESGRWETV